MSTTPLPPLYARWMEQCLGGDLPPEDRATCLDCAMCGERAERDGTPADLQFNPSTKCCTYHPDLPNFGVGAILRDETPGLTGRPTVAQRVRDRLGATPLGLFAGPAFLSRFQATLAMGADVSGWGRDAEKLCPYYNAEGGGLCGIWLHRNGVCSTWFCKHRDGALGQRFWLAVKKLLGAAERALARWCLVELAFDRAAMNELYDASGEPRALHQGATKAQVDAEGRIRQGLAKRIWGRWYGREEELYRACAERVLSLDWPRVLAIGGEPVEELEALAKAARPELHASADVLCRGQFASMPLRRGRHLRVRSAEATYEPLDLPADTASSLAAFDGRPTGEVVASLAKSGVMVDAPLLDALRHRGILVPPDGKDLPPIARKTGPLAPDDELRFFRGYRGAEPSLKESAGEDGRRTLLLSCGGPAASFDDPSSFRFVREIHRHGSGFRAGDAVKWLGGGAATWDAVRGVLEGLLAAEILQRTGRVGGADD